MIGASPFIESLWILVTQIETQLLVAIVFPAIAIGIAIKFMRNLHKEK
jgi:hypothetical protein